MPAPLHPHLCDGCGVSCETSLLLEVPVPADLLAQLGLPVDSSHLLRKLCPQCMKTGLRGRKLSLLDLVELAPAEVKQRIHARLMHDFEI